MSIVEIVVSALVILATVMVVATAVAMWRAPDALTRANLIGPVVGVGVPLLLLSKLIIDWSTTGFDLNNFIRAILAIAGVWIVGAVGSYYIGRSIYGVTVVDKKHAEDRAYQPGA
ncbi:MAG: Na+/H+ antiporter subunit G [Corynebacterium marinum]|jgi:multicomponent Na+:H+ antiporter subunit G|uniref:Na+/H+ antiporter subunit G n=1 Tax=Corynebacterium marinum TaxID=349751 RepID=A0A847H7R4_9CORY|nr:Na+/H+ antiporter subunit G [Corynebacterium marinum]